MSPARAFHAVAKSFRVKGSVLGALTMSLATAWNEVSPQSRPFEGGAVGVGATVDAMAPIGAISASGLLVQADWLAEQPTRCNHLPAQQGQRRGGPTYTSRSHPMFSGWHWATSSHRPHDVIGTWGRGR